MKKSMMLVLTIVVMLQLQAQKIKVADGDIKVLKGETLIDLDFTYDDDMKVGKYSEDEYVKKKMAEIDEDEPGAGKKWKAAWYEDRSVHFEPKYMQLINQYAADKDVIFRPGMRDAKYKMIVNTVFIEPGFNVGVARKNASIDLEITIVPVGNEEKVLAKIMLYDSPGRSMSYGDYDVGVRVGEAYAKAGKEIAKFLIKKKAF